MTDKKSVRSPNLADGRIIFLNQNDKTYYHLELAGVRFKNNSHTPTPFISTFQKTLPIS